MSFPIICHHCGNKEELAKLSDLSACSSCGGGDIDLDDFEASVKTAVDEKWTEMIGDYLLVVLGTDDDWSWSVMDQSDSGKDVDQGLASTKDAAISASRDVANKAAREGGQLFATKTAQRVSDKLHEIVAGVLTTNPSMTREAAYEVAQKTVTRYPKVAGVTDDAIAMLNEGYEAGLVEADAVQWFAPSEAGQAIAQEEVGEVPA